MTTDNKTPIGECLWKVNIFHFVFYPPMTPSWHSLLIGGVILFLLQINYIFIVDVFQDL